MLSNAKLFSVGDFDFRLQHLLIIGILALAVSTSALLRAQPAEYGFALHEFDPYFNYRATQYIVDNGFDAYLEWNDDMSWHPYGRDVSMTSQVSLHIITATLYNIFGGNSSLFDFTIMLPLVLGSLTCIAVFAMVRVIGGTTAGLIASLLFAISLPIVVRNLVGWFKSEPLGLFLGFIGIYLLLSAIKINKGKISFLKIVFAGIFIAMGFSAWGGIQFFLLPVALFFASLPFFYNDKRFLLWVIPTFSVSLLVTTLLFERLSTTMPVISLIVVLPTLIMVIILIVQKFSSAETRIRNSIITLVILLGSGITSLVGLLSANILPSPAIRYLIAMNPFETVENQLIASVSEHQTTDLYNSFSYLSIFIIFGLIGAWLIFSTRANTSIPNHMKAFALIFGLLGLYVSSSFIRLELFGAISLIILGSLGLTILLQQIFKQQNIAIKFIFCAVIIGLIITPMVVPEGNNWVTEAKPVPTIFSGASFYSIVTNDWTDALHWLKENTPEDAVIFSWWDYGYWIETVGERTTLVDNATTITWQIEKVAKTFLTPTDDAWVILNSDYKTNVSEHYFRSGMLSTIDQKVMSPGDYFRPCVEFFTGEKVPEASVPFDVSRCSEAHREDIEKYGAWNPQITGLDADYVLIYLVGARYETESIPVYDLVGGGDESKKQWWMAIAGMDNPDQFIHVDQVTPTDEFMYNTLFGDLIPFSILSYLDEDTMTQYDTYRPGLHALYVKDIKLQDPNGPFTLVYASPSFSETKAGILSTVLIYKVNHDFKP